MTRRTALKLAAGSCLQAFGSPIQTPALAQFGYGQVQFPPGPLEQQFRENQQLLLSLNEDSMLRPFRVREGLPAPGQELGGWYSTDAFAPGATYGQWMSALARFYAATGDEASRAKVDRMVRGYAATIDPTGRFYVENRFPSYIYDKLVCGLIDAHTFAKNPIALATLSRATDAAASHLPDKAVARQETPVLAREDFTRHCWDESYTLPENLFLAARRTGHPRYRMLAQRLLFDGEFFDPLARGENVLPGKHAYSHVNALSSAVQAYLSLGNEKYLRAAKNGFRMVEEQSYATGGWGPDEHFFPPGSGRLGETLRGTHSSFETPCGAYAHLKIARYLLRIAKDPHYGDSLERVLYNTVLGATPIQPDGAAFYYSDYNFKARKTVHPDKWPCCSGTLPQIAANYQISAYFQDSRGVYVNLFVPSTLTWGSYSLRQTSAYPYESGIRFDITAARPGAFSIWLRIPGWAEAAALMVNGRPGSQELKAGTFAEIRREWKTGDRIELNLPLTMRLEAVDREHPDTVAVLRGPLVLMAVGDSSAKQFSRAELLSAPRNFKPFMDIRDERYTAYLQVGPD